MVPETAEGIFRIVGIVFILLVLAIRFYYSRKARVQWHSRPNRWEQRWGPIVRMITGMMGGVFLLLWLAVPEWIVWCRLPLPIEVRWLGAGLVPFSVGFLGWVHATLDTNFSPTLELARQHRLVTKGPYRWIRHPMYTALLLTGCALFFLSANAVVGGVTVPVMVVTILQRIPGEEAMLVERFGAAYEAYRQQTGALLPPWFPLKRAKVWEYQ